MTDNRSTGVMVLRNSRIGHEPPKNERDICRMADDGIRFVINLERDALCDEQIRNCENWGLEYSHLPIFDYLRQDDYSKASLLYRQFAELANYDDCYVYGRRNAIISLCAYWVFDGADRNLRLLDVFHLKNLYSFVDMVFDGDDMDMGILLRTIEMMQEHLDVRLPNDIFRIRKQRFYGNHPLTPSYNPYRTERENEVVAEYSFLHLIASERFGLYNISMKDMEEPIGWIKEPGRNKEEWTYSISFAGKQETWETSSFSEARDCVFEFIYENASPAEYLELMDLSSI